MSKHSADDRWIETLTPISFRTPLTAHDRNWMAKALAQQPTFKRPTYLRRVWDAPRGH